MRYLAITALLLLGACTTAADRERDEQRRQAFLSEQKAKDRATCISYGFEEGTLPYAQCRMMIDQQRQQSNAHMQGIIMNRMLAPK